MTVAPPPNVLDLPSGFKLCAGLTESTILPTWDVETYSEAGFVFDEQLGRWRKPDGAPSGKQAGLPLVGARVYFEHPTADVLMVGYDLKDGRGRRQWFPPTEPVPADLRDHILAGLPLEAHNAGFEDWAAQLVLGPKYGLPVPTLDQIHCSMAKCRAWCLAPALSMAGDILGIETPKDKEGKALIKLFSTPRNPTKTDPSLRVHPLGEPEKWRGYCAYNLTDVIAESQVSAKVPDLSPAEREYWKLDRTINRRGVYVDRESLDACIEVLEQATAKYNAELYQLTNGAVPEASKREAFIAWLHTRNLHTDSLDDENLTWLIDAAAAAGDEICSRALWIRKQIASASVKKVYAMRLCMTAEGRMHDLEDFHGARTGRPTGRGPQPTNLPNSGPNVHHCWSCGRWFPAAMAHCPGCGAVAGPQAEEWNPEAVEAALKTFRTRSLEAVEFFWHDPIGTMSGCLRGLYAAAPGHDFIGSDYSAIEAVVNAALSGCEWRMEVFRTTGKIYEASAAQTFKVPFEEILQHKVDTGNHHPLRKKGKVTELALGYLGWIGALRVMGYDGSDEEAKELILAWRDASPEIVYLGGGQKVPTGVLSDHAAFAAQRPWDPFRFGLEGMALNAIENPGQTFPVNRLDGSHSGLSWLCYNDVLYMLLPDGTRIAYHRPRIEPAMQAWRGLAISFEGFNTNTQKAPYGWIRMPLYAGIMLENACQAVANRILRHGQHRVEAAGYAVVLHVYDENLAEVPEGFGSVEEFEREMSVMPPWAVDQQGRPWPIFARGGWRGKRFRK